MYKPDPLKTWSDFFCFFGNLTILISAILFLLACTSAAVGRDANAILATPFLLSTGIALLCGLGTLVCHLIEKRREKLQERRRQMRLAVQRAQRPGPRQQCSPHLGRMLLRQRNARNRQTRNHGRGGH